MEPEPTKGNWVDITKQSGKELPVAEKKVEAHGISVQSLPQPIQDFNVRETGFRVVYAPSRVPMFNAVRTAFQRDRMFERFADSLNSSLKMPRTIDIQMVQCGTVNAFYDPRRSRIIVCYELVAYFAKLFRPVSRTNAQLGTAIKGATTFAFYHELGHALIHTLKIPAVGREEDAVDQLATLILMGGGDRGVRSAMAGAKWFDLQGKRRRKMRFWDEHSLDPQRFYNIACLIFGSSPRTYSWIVRGRVLPTRRAKRCPREYSKIKTAWNRLLRPHLRTTRVRPPTPPTTTRNPNGGVPATEPERGPRRPPVTRGRVSCAKVAVHASRLLRKKTQASTRAMHPGQAQQVMGELKARMPTFLMAVLKACRAKWSPRVRACIVNARTMAQANRCGAR